MVGCIMSHYSGAGNREGVAKVTKAKMWEWTSAEVAALVAQQGRIHLHKASGAGWLLIMSPLTPKCGTGDCFLLKVKKVKPDPKAKEARVN